MCLLENIFLKGQHSGSEGRGAVSLQPALTLTRRLPLMRVFRLETLLCFSKGAVGAGGPPRDPDLCSSSGAGAAVPAVGRGVPRHLPAARSAGEAVGEDGDPADQELLLRTQVMPPPPPPTAPGRWGQVVPRPQRVCSLVTYKRVSGRGWAQRVRAHC